MLSIPATYTYNDGALFPNTKAVNSSGAFTTDGTEFMAEMVNDYMWGIMQALLNYTGQTPNGILESNSNSQFLESMRRGFSYPGEIFAAAWNQDPALLGIKAIKLVGQGILRSNYTLLDQAVYCGDSNNGSAPAFYHSDNAAGTTRNIAGIYLILPDCRGHVIRALDTAGVADPDGPSRKLGSKQSDAIIEFAGSFAIFGYAGGSIIFFNTGVFTTTPGPVATQISTASTTPSTLVNFNASGSTETSTETRMKNISFDFYIRY